MNPGGLRRCRARALSQRPAAGFTLVEMMVAVTLGLMIVAGLATVFSSSSSSAKANDRVSDIEFNGRYSLNALKQELRQAGYRGYTWAELNPPSTSLGTVSGECGDGSGLFVSNLRQRIWGANDSNPFSGNCLPASEKNGAEGGDVLVIRRVDGTPVAAPSANTFYFRSTYGAGEVFRGTTVPASIGIAAPLASFALQEFVYYVSPYTASPSEVPLVPALYRVALQTDGSMKRELVATGIEQLQIQYGRHTTAPDLRYFNTFSATNCPGCTLDTGAATTSSPTVWDDIKSVRLWILSRSASPEPGFVNRSSYVMGDKTYTVNDGFRRQLFTTVVQLRN